MPPEPPGDAGLMSVPPSTVPGMTARCLTSIRLTDDELLQCETVSNPVYEPQDRLRCKLQDSHPGASSTCGCGGRPGAATW